MLPRQPHSPIVGKNSASHTSGGHINAILKNPLAYQPFDPRDVGSEISFVFGPLSGSNHAQQILAKFGYQCTDSEKVAVTQAIKDCYADRRKGITDDELLLAYKKYRAAIKLKDLSYAKDNSGKTIVTFHGQFFSQQDLVVEYQGRSSALSALNKAVNAQMPTITVIDYNSRSKGVTVDATCASTIFIDYNGKHFNAEAEDDDIEISALKAFIAAVNMAYVEEHFKLN
jgi:2-isopropylmalate synthase